LYVCSGACVYNNDNVIIALTVAVIILVAYYSKVPMGGGGRGCGVGDESVSE